jgi:hypothetical protein
LHVACVAPTGSGQGEQLEPQEFVLKFAWQSPAQSWLPSGQVPSHAWLFGMHAPAQSFNPMAHSPRHWPLTQVAVPPAGATQGSHEVPQLAGLALLTHAVPQRWESAPHSIAQTPSRHRVEPPVAAGHSVQFEPQPLVSVSSRQRSPQRW